MANSGPAVRARGHGVRLCFGLGGLSRAVHPPGKWQPGVGPWLPASLRMPHLRAFIPKGDGDPLDAAGSQQISSSMRDGATSGSRLNVFTSDPPVVRVARARVPKSL